STPSLYTLSLHDALPISVGFFSGFTKATTVPGEMPVRIARPSLTARTLTSCISKLRLRLQYTTFFPPCSKTAPPGMETARERLRSEEHTSELQSRFDIVC